MKIKNAYTTITEMTHGIILSEFNSNERIHEPYQSETQLEEKLISDLEAQGYTFVPIQSSEDLMKNLKIQIEKLNQTSFTPFEWERFLAEYLDAPNDGIIEKTKKVQEDHVYDFIFDDGHIQNIKILDKKNIHNNFLQVTNQVVQVGKYENRYDVTILVNGLPLIQVELKKRGVNLKEAFNQIHRYSKESFNHQGSLYKYVQIFVISNGTFTRYFANTTAQDKNNYEFTCEWADSKNTPIKDLEDFTATFFDKRTLLEVLTKYCVFTIDHTLLIMRPYQIAATERILWKLQSSYENRQWSKPEGGGYIWHTTGSGKTLTSFKTARLATELAYIDKVFFVVDRKDLDYQTMKEYQKFQADSVSGSQDTRALKSAIEKEDGKIIVTTIQKLNHFVKSNEGHAIYDKHCVLIFDECHRSQFGLAQKLIRKKFKKYYQFGFTGTPIFKENALGPDTTESIFGVPLHSYVITHAIQDKKVLKFKVDYNNILPKFKEAEEEAPEIMDDKVMAKLEKKLLLHPERIETITKHILKVYRVKTHRNTFYTHKSKSISGFNAMFAVQSIEAAKLYYEAFAQEQKNLPEEKRLRVATIFSFAPNEKQSAIGELGDETFEPSALDHSGKEFLEKVMEDYNENFKTNFSIEGNGFQNYYRDLSLKVKNKEVDLLIVVGMFLTGFDAPTLNTLFIDKNLKYHGLIQAFSRTNRILNEVKTFGNIVCFRDLEPATREAIKTFGDTSKEQMDIAVALVLERSYEDYMEGFKDDVAEERSEGYIHLCNELVERFPEPVNIEREADKRDFCKLFGELLKVENVLKNYDEFSTFTPIISAGHMQDLKSVYVDIRDELQQRNKEDETLDQLDFSEIEFQIELLKTDEINLDYILGLVLEKTKQKVDPSTMKEDVRRLIRSSIGTRAKEGLILGFIDKADFDSLQNQPDILEAFYTYARAEKEQAIVAVSETENLKADARRFIEKSIEKGVATASGAELDQLLPPTSRRAGAREAKKQTVLKKIQEIVKVFVDI